jgi:uncharacterized membrane protein
MKFSVEKQRLAIIGLLLGWCTLLQAYCYHRTGDRLALGLEWNLFLAALPLLWGGAFRAACQEKRSIIAGFFFMLWLVFLPNAPYILTDLVHLNGRPLETLWYYLAMLLSCAGTGTLLGYLSLLNVHQTVEQAFGKVAGWSVASGALILSGFGIYLGRFLRWNSWDLFTNPGELLQTAAGQFVNPSLLPHPVPVTLIFGVGLLLGYAAFRVLTAPIWGIAPSKVAYATSPAGTPEAAI